MKKMDEVEILKRYSRCDMKRESLALCRRFLLRKNLSSYAFVTITDALLVHANKLQRWKRSIEAALGKIPLNARPYVTKQLFYFYVSISDWRSASVYLPKAPITHADLLFSMWTHLEMRDVRQAKKIFHKCQRKLRAEADNLDDFALCTIYEALASYLPRTTSALMDTRNFPARDNLASILNVRFHDVRGLFV